MKENGVGKFTVMPCQHFFFFITICYGGEAGLMLLAAAAIINAQYAANFSTMCRHNIIGKVI